jgi:hypothetical protein
MRRASHSITNKCRVDERLVNLSPGMAVTVEIKTGTRRIISYLLSPLARYAHDSLQERDAGGYVRPR